MYRAFDLKLNENMMEMDLARECSVYGKNLIDVSRSDIESILSDVFLNGTIDGSALTERYFPTLRRDVFLSYSHDDQSLAHLVAGMLKVYFDLDVFVDSIFWGSADKLLKQIDNQYCYQESSGTYNYKKRNLSTAHVHAMLTSAIMKAMDQAEIVIFLNTPNSAPKLSDSIAQEGFSERTLSPWIYEEVLLTTMLKETAWTRYRQDWRIDENALIHFEKSVSISYKLPTEKMIPLTIDDISEWMKRYEKRKKVKPGRYGDLFTKPWQHEKHPLNVLYEMKCGIEEG